MLLGSWLRLRNFLAGGDGGIEAIEWIALSLVITALLVGLGLTCGGPGGAFHF